MTYLQWLQKAEARGLDIIALTDHNTVEGVARLRSEIERLTWLEANERLRLQERRDLDEYRRLGEKLLVLPGFEFTATFGFHIFAIFSPETPVRTLELLLLRLNVPLDRLTEGSTEVGASTDVLTAYRLLREAGGIVIAAHVNSAHGVAMRNLNFGGQTKIAYTQDPNLHALEVTDLESAGRRSTALFFDGSKPEYPRRMHCIQGSDAHRLIRDPKDKNRLGIGDRVTAMLLPEVTFEALKAVFEGQDFTRIQPYRPLAETPFDPVEAAREQGNTIVQAFHENITREGGRLNKILCDVVAFANTRGGTVYIGASAARRGPPRGVENPETVMGLLRKELERNITPLLDARVDVVQSQELPVIRINVPNGPDKPYALNQTRIYVRQEGETNEAVRDELMQLVLTGRKGAVQAQPAPVPITAPAAEPPQIPAPPREHLPPAEKPAPPAAEPVSDVRLPAIGVEIVSVEDRKGTRHFTIRDLRNGNLIQNVTLASARKLWSYAINQHLTNPLDASRVTWSDDLGMWQVARRAKKLRYDLVLRQSDGGLRVFYGVTADGMVGPWQRFLEGEDKAMGDTEAKAAPAIEAVAAPAAEARIGAEAAPASEASEAAEPAKPQPEPSPARRRRSRRSGEPVAKAEPQVEAAAPEAAAPQPKPKGGSRRPRTRSPQTGAEVGAVSPSSGESKASAPDAGQAVLPTELPTSAPAAPKASPRRRKPAVETPAPDGAAPAADAQARPRSRRRKPEA